MAGQMRLRAGRLDNTLCESYRICSERDRRSKHMCIASGGVIIEKRGHKADVDFGGNIVEAEAGLTQCEVGDRVLVHAGCIIQKLTETEAEEMDEILRLMEEL